MAKKIILKVIPGEAMNVDTLEIQKTYKGNDGTEHELPPFKYRSQFVGMLTQSPPNEGMDYDKMTKHLDLVDKIKAHKDGEDVILEDEEWRLLRDRLKKAQFTFASRTVLDMIRHVDEAPVCKKLEEVKQAETVVLPETPAAVEA